MVVGEPVGEAAGETLGAAGGDIAGVVVAAGGDAGDVSGEAAGVSEPEPQALKGSSRPMTDTTEINLLFIKNLSNTTNGHRFSIDRP